MLDKTSPIPLYYQLAQQLRERVRVGELRPGGLVPAERELSEVHGISRMTVRQALQYLVREEVLVARKGMGTYVAEPKIVYDPMHVLGFTEEMMRRGANASSRVIALNVVPASSAIAAKLDLIKGDKVIRIMRLRLGGAVPLLLETVHVPAARFPGLELADMARTSLYALMRDRYGVAPAGARHTMQAVPSSDEEAGHFGIPVGTPMILFQGVTVDDANVPIEYFKAVYRGDRFEVAFDTRGRPDAELNTARMNILMRA